MQYKVTTSNPPTCVVRQAYVTKKILDRQIHFASMRNGLLFLADFTFTTSRKNKVWAIFTTLFALTLTLTLLTLTLNPKDAVTINYSLFLRLAVSVTNAFVLPIISKTTLSTL